MNYKSIMQKYCIDAPEPTKADVDTFLKNEQEIMRLNGLMDNLKANARNAKGYLEKAKKLYMYLSKNKALISAMAEKKMLGPWTDSFSSIERRWKGMYKYISQACIHSIRGRDPRFEEIKF